MGINNGTFADIRTIWNTDMCSNSIRLFYMEAKSIKEAASGIEKLVSEIFNMIEHSKP